MKRYYIVWLIIILVVDLLAGGYMASTGGRYIKRNREYIKVRRNGNDPNYSYSVEVRDEETDLDYYTRIEGKPINVNHTLLLEVREISNCDLIYIFGLLGIIDILLAGFAAFFYNNFESVHARPGVRLGFIILYVVFIVGVAFAGSLYHQYITTPGKIYDYYDSTGSDLSLKEWLKQ